MGVTNPNTRPRLQRHPSFPIPHPEIQRSAPPPAPRAGSRYRPTGVFAQPVLRPPTRTLARPAPVKRNERRLPPAVMPSYPTLRHYTPAQQRAVVRGIQNAGRRSPDRLAIRPTRPGTAGPLRPLLAVRQQQEAAANKRYARGFNVTPQQAAVLRAVSNVRSQASPGRGISGQQLIDKYRRHGFLERFAHALISDPTGSNRQQLDLEKRGLTALLQPAPTPYDPFPRHVPYSGPLGLGTLAGSLSYGIARNTRVAGDAGQALSTYLRKQSRQTRSGSGGTAITPAFLRSPLADVLLGASKAAPVLSRVGAGAANDVGQYVLGAVPTVAMLGQQAIHDPGAALKSLEQGMIDPLKHPLDHPLFALAMLHGGIRGVSRTVGAIGRSPFSPASVRRALTTERSPLQIAGPGNKRLLMYRHYSKDPLVKAVQVLFDRKLQKGAKVADQHGKMVDARLAAESKLASVLGQDAAGQLRRFADHTADRANAVERANRAAITQELVKLMPTREHRGGVVGQAVGGYVDRMLHSQPHGRARLPARAYRPERDVVSLVHTGIIRNAKTFKADLEQELRVLQERAKRSFDNPQERAANLERQHTIARVLNDPRAMANAHRIVAAGRALAIRGRDLTERAVRDGALTREQADRAPLFDYAIRHMGARHVTVQEHRALEQAALARERAAAEHVRTVEQSAKPLVYQHEVKQYVRHSAVKEPVYAVRGHDTARRIQSTGLDPGRARKGTFAAGTYAAIGKADRNYQGTAVEAYADVRKPFVVHNDTAMQQLKPYREAAMEKVGRDNLEAVSQEMTRLLKRDGYDAVIVRGAGHEGQDWVNVFDPHKIRVTAPRASVRTGEIHPSDAAAIAKDAGVRLVSHKRADGGAALEFHGARDQVEHAVALVADHTGTPTRVLHEIDGGEAVAYFHNGQLVHIDPAHDPAIVSRLRARYGGNLEARYGDATDIQPGMAEGARGRVQEARRQTPARTAAGEPRATHNTEEALAAAKAAHAAAREHRIAVSGRHPAAVKRYEAAQAALHEARTRADHAATAHARAEKARLRLVGAQSSRRGRRQAEQVGGHGLTHTRGERTAGRASAEERRKLAAANEAVKHAKELRTAAEQAHRELRQRLAQVKLPDAQAGLRKPDGTFLSNEEIHQHMRTGGGDPSAAIPFDQHGPQVAYLPHTPDFNSRAAYHRAQALIRRDTVESGFQRTGRSLEKGTVGTSYDALAQHHLRMGITTGDGAIGQFDKLAHEAAIVDADGKPFTNAGADQHIENLSAHPDQPQLVKYRFFQGRFTPEQKATIQRLQSPASFDPSAYGSLTDYVEKSFAERIAKPGETPAWAKSGERNIGLLPKALVDRYQEHLTILGNRSPTGALLAQAFRTAVLPFSAKWLTGNVAEAIIRLAVIGANPFDYVAGRKVMAQATGREARTIMGRQVLREIIGLDAEHAGLSKELRSSLLGGLFYGNRGLTVHRDASYYENTTLKAPAEFIGGLTHTTLLREFGHEIGRIPRSIFAINRLLERQAQITALGRYARRDIQEFTNSWTQTVRLQDRAVREAARGLYNTPAQADAARFMDETLGKYSRFSPRVRALIQTAAPFLPWYLNSVRFVFWTMPMKHPTVTAALLAAETTFGKDIAQQHKDLPPGELKSAVPAGGGWRDLARFTPFGAFTGLFGDPAKGYEHLTDPFLPQVQGIYNAMRGQDPFGRDLQVAKTPGNPQGKPTPGDIRTNIANQALGSFIPGLAPLQRVAEHGETPYGNSSLIFGIHTKPDTSHGYSGFGRLLDPFRPVFLKKKAAGGKPPGMSTADYNRALQRARQLTHQHAANPGAQQRALERARRAAGVGG